MSFTYPLRNRFVQERLLEARFIVVVWLWLELRWDVKQLESLILAQNERWRHA